MSRLLRGFCSAVRNQWVASGRSAPQSVCHDGETKNTPSSAQVADQEGKCVEIKDVEHMHKISTVTINKPCLLGIRNGRLENLHHICAIKPIQSSATCNIESSQCDTDENEANASVHDKQNTTGNTNKARWEFGFDTGGSANSHSSKGEEKQGCYKKFSDPIHYSPLESLSLGAALVLGFHLSKAWDLYKKIPSLNCVYKTAIAMPMQPSTSASPHPQKERNTENLQAEDSKTSTVYSQLDSLELQAASADWEDLSQRYTVQVCERLAGWQSRAGNLKEAADLWQHAVKLGSSRSAYNLALCYKLGKGVEQDLTKAVELFQEAGSLGHKLAQKNLLLMGVSKTDFPVESTTHCMRETSLQEDDPEQQKKSELSAEKLLAAQQDSSEKKWHSIHRSRSSPGSLYMLGESSPSHKPYTVEEVGDFICNSTQLANLSNSNSCIPEPVHVREEMNNTAFFMGERNSSSSMMLYT